MQRRHRRSVLPSLDDQEGTYDDGDDRPDRERSELRRRARRLEDSERLPVLGDGYDRDAWPSVGERAEIRRQVWGPEC